MGSDEWENKKIIILKYDDKKIRKYGNKEILI